jgi:hypothetical protein
MTRPLAHPATQKALREARFVYDHADDWALFSPHGNVFRRGDIALVSSRINDNTVVVVERGRTVRYLRGTLELMAWLAENQP